MIFRKMYYLHFPFTRLNPPAEGKKTRTELVHRTNNARKIDEWQPAVMKGPSDALKTLHKSTSVLEWEARRSCIPSRLFIF